MIDPFGVQKNNLTWDNIYIYQFFYSYIKPIKGYSLLNNLSWDSYILSHFSKISSKVIYIGNIYLTYNKSNKTFTQSNINPEYFIYIIKLIQKTKPNITKVLIVLELQLEQYHHLNSICINLKNKTINIFEPWGKYGRFRNVMNFYTKIKISALKPIFKYFKNYKILDIAQTYNIIGPQDSRLCVPIKNINTVPMNSLIVTKKYLDKNLFLQKIDDKYVYVTLYPEKNNKLLKINKNEKFNYPCGFDIDNGICDLYCLYFSLLVLTNPSQTEANIHKYISDSKPVNIQTKMLNVLQWIIQWYYFQLSYFRKNRYQLSIQNNFISFNTFLIKMNTKLINNYNRLSSSDKKESDIMSYKVCKKINMSKIYTWLLTFLAKQYNIESDFVHRLIEQDTRIKNKCILYLSIKNLYDLSN